LRGGLKVWFDLFKNLNAVKHFAVISQYLTDRFTKAQAKFGANVEFTNFGCSRQTLALFKRYA